MSNLRRRSFRRFKVIIPNSLFYFIVFEYVFKYVIELEGLINPHLNKLKGYMQLKIIEEQMNTAFGRNLFPECFRH